MIGLEKKHAARIRLVVIDLWKSFRNAIEKAAPQAAILADKFHILRHLGDALDAVRKSEYAWLRGQDRPFIKGQKYTLLWRRENWPTGPQEAADCQQAAQYRLPPQGVLRPARYEREGWARRFFENWRASTTWQRLKPYQKFAQMIEHRWDGIAAYCKPEKPCVSSKDLNNKIRVLQRRAYRLGDEEYLRLKMLPPL